MYGEIAIELIRQLDRSSELLLPPFSEEHVRQILEEMHSLFQQNQADAVSVQSQDGDKNLYISMHWRHAALERNRRCLLAYLYNRLLQLKKMRWEIGSILPPIVKSSLSDLESKWFIEYNKNLASYMGSIGPYGGLDLTQDRSPPTALYLEVRCLENYGELKTQRGINVLLKKDTVHLLPRSDAEPLIRQGILMQTDS